jgi:phosphoribosyl 1,2-cyclic phosphate phosphodiesterase
LRDRPHPTHLTVRGAVEASQAIGALRSYLTHLTHEKCHVDRLRELPAGVELAYDGLKFEFELAPPG